VSDLLRPHWRHKECRGIVVGIGNTFKCDKCNQTGPAMGAVLPRNMQNEAEYLAAHPELEVTLLSSEELGAYPGTRFSLR